MSDIFRYTLVSLQASSERYGPCEVCKKHVSEVFLQREERHYEEGEIHGWTRWGCHQLFGHKACLESKQQGKEVTV